MNKQKPMSILLLCTEEQARALQKDTSYCVYEVPSTYSLYAEKEGVRLYTIPYQDMRFVVTNAEHTVFLSLDGKEWIGKIEDSQI